MEQKILFEKDKIKLTRVHRNSDKSVIAVSFQMDGQKFFVREGYGEDGDYIKIYSVDKFGTRTPLGNDFGCGIDCILRYNDSAIKKRYSQWKKSTNVRGHSKKQALLSIPYSQYDTSLFVDLLNRHFGMNKDAVQARDWVVDYIDRCIDELENIKAKDKYLKPYLKDYPEICEEINSVIKQLKPILKKVKATTF